MPHRHLAKLRHRNDPLTDCGAQRRHVRDATGTDETTHGEQTGDEEDIHLARVVEHEIRLVDRGQTLRRHHDSMIRHADWSG